MSRLRAIKSFVEERNGLIPNNIILHFFDEEVRLHGDELQIPGKPCAWVIDGQHRLFGFAESSKDYDLLVTGLISTNQKKVVETFVTINTEQTKLPTSLCLDLLAITGTEEDVNTRCRDIVCALNEDEDSPWYGKVDMTGESPGFISLVNFVRKVKPLVANNNGVLYSFTLQDQIGSLKNYWIALKQLFSEQWGRSQLTKTLGFGAVMNTFPAVFTQTLASKNGFRVDDILSYLEPISDFDFSSEQIGSGTGNKAEMTASRLILDKLDDFTKMTGKTTLRL